MAAYAALVWSVLFAALSFYWAAGGSAGVDMLARSIQDQAEEREPGFVALVGATGVLKLAGGVLALALTRPWRTRVPRRLLVFLPRAAGLALVVYGGANMLRYAAMAAGITEVPEAVGDDAVFWYLVLWEPIWILGGVLFLLAARDYSRLSALVPGEPAG